MPEGNFIHANVYEAKHQALEEKVEDIRRVNEKRLDSHHEDIAELKKLQIQNTIIMERLAEQQERMDKRLEQIEQQPSEKWTLIVKTMITAVASAIAGGFIASIVSSIQV